MRGRSKIYPLCLAVIVGGAGCARWGSETSYGPQTEVGRRLVGSPQVEEVISSNVSADYGSTTQIGYDTRVTSGGRNSSRERIRRTHCVQQAEIEYVQPYDVAPRSQRRWMDVAGSVTLALAGSVIILGARDSYQHDQRFYQRDPSFFPKPSTPTVAYSIGGGLVTGALAWLGYSLLGLPSGARPSSEAGQRRWTELQYVEASGCGLVPADRQ